MRWLKVFFAKIEEMILGETIIDFGMTSPIPSGLTWRAEDQRRARVAKGKMSLQGALEAMKKRGNFSPEAMFDQDAHNGNIFSFGCLVLEAALKNPESIPEEWGDGQAIFFYGDIYRDEVNELVIRGIRKTGKHWEEVRAYYVHGEE